MTAYGQHRRGVAASALRQALAHRIDALDGYPVAALIDTFPEGTGNAGAVLRHVLEQWIARLDDDLGVIPDDPSPALADIKRRILETRGAMAQLLDLVRPLLRDEETMRRPGVDQRQLSAQARSGDGGGGQLH